MIFTETCDSERPRRIMSGRKGRMRLEDGRDTEGGGGGGGA